MWSSFFSVHACYSCILSRESAILQTAMFLHPFVPPPPVCPSVRDNYLEGEQRQRFATNARVSGLFF